MSSTSDADSTARSDRRSGPGQLGLRSIVAVVRVVHPFPSALDAIATAAIALIGGASLAVAVRLGMAMLLIQFGIGASNDALDREVDAGRPEKAVASGLVPAALAIGLSAVVTAAGLLVAAFVSPVALLIGLFGVAIGLLYNLRLNRTALGWLAFAAGVGLLPVFALSGASGCTGPADAAVFALALVGGASLAAANALADLETDEGAGTATIAVKLGRRRTLLVNAASLAAADLIAAVSAVAITGGRLAPGVVAGFVAGLAVSWTGFAVTARRRTQPNGGWEIQAIGLVVTGLVWLVALGDAAALSVC